MHAHLHFKLQSNLHADPAPATAKPQPAPRQRAPWGQRGSIVISGAIALSLLVIVLLGSELGYLFYMKREYQKGVDLAALAGAQAVLPTNCAPAQAAAVANADLNLKTGLVTTAMVVCGRWDAKNLPAPFHFAAGSQPFNAVRIELSNAPPLLMPFLPGNESRNIEVMAQAAQLRPQASLSIRTTLASLNEGALNKVLGALLGSNLNVNLVGWQGLAGTDIKLLSFLDQLAIDLNINAGNYQQVLQTDATVGALLKAMATVLQQSGSTAQATLNALDDIRLAANIASAQPLVKLGDLLDIQTGTSAAGLDLDLQAFQLVEGILQLANGNNSLVASIPVSILGKNTSIKLKVTEPPQISAVGDPDLAALAPYGTDAIAVRTAQIRAVVSVDLSGLGVVGNLTSLVSNLLSPIASLLTSLLRLDLSCLLGCTRVDIAKDAVRLSVYLEAATSQANVTGVNCNSAAEKSLDVAANISAAHLSIGKMTEAQELAALNSGPRPSVDPIPLVDVFTRACSLFCPEKLDSRVALKVDSSVLESTQTKRYSAPPEINARPPEVTANAGVETFSAKNIVGSLTSTLDGLKLQTFQYDSTKPNGLGVLLDSTTRIVDAALTTVGNIVKTLLSPLLDPLVNALLEGLGIQLAQTDVGARLSCSRGVELVY